MSTSHRTRGYGWFLYPGLTVLVVFFFGMFSWNVGISLLKQAQQQPLATRFVQLLMQLAPVPAQVKPSDAL